MAAVEALAAHLVLLELNLLAVAVVQHQATPALAAMAKSSSLSSRRKERT
jgi:hypothetical protein